jgi:citrate lyase subunit beta-like protein
VAREILRSAKIVNSMTRAHATQKGAVGLDLGDEKGNKEMVDAPMLKQVTSVGIWIHSFT